MKKLKKISLANLSKEKLAKREQNCILGGEDCCACNCITGVGAIGRAGGGIQIGTDYGYGVGRFA